MTIHLSARTRWDLRVSALHRAAQGRSPLDLTVSNPTAVGFHYDALPVVEDRVYRPEPLGLPVAREAVAAYYEARGITVDPARVWLTAGTSEAYAHLFALLCDPGDAVLVPRPGYPLIDHLADLAGVRQVPYRLAYGEGWFVDHVPTDEVRAAIVVAPGNPTGHVPTPDEVPAAPVHVVDEVFADYALELDPAELARRRAQYAGPHFLLSGLSKVAALPQLKLSWVVAQGEELDDAIARAEVVADAYLSVATPVQRALPELLAGAAAMQARIRQRCRHNLAALDRCLEGAPVSRLRADAGWTALLRLPALADVDDEAWALHILQRADTLVQPGYLFDIEAPPCAAVSLLTPEAEFERGIARLVEAVAVLP